MAMIVDAKGAIESRPVTTVGVQGQNWIVTEGIKTGEKVVVDGVRKLCCCLKSFLCYALILLFC